jgi:ribulose-phosphate 3-epimerase
VTVRPLVAPSLLAADLSHLAEEVRAVEAAGADWLHIDIMDGHFVPNLTMGPDIVAAVDRVSQLPLDVHLMIDNPADFIEPFAHAGADYISFHTEAVDDVEAVLSRIERAGCKPAVALNPQTAVESVSPLISRAAMILVMSVHPGFAGQGFVESALAKMRTLADLKRRCSSQCLLEMDGGIKADNASRVTAAGTEVLVAGSGIFAAGDYPTTISALKGET